MAYVVSTACHKCKYTDCVAVCPVDCFFELDSMLVIHPDQCIDCGACEPECPVTAIFEESDLPVNEAHMMEFNTVASGAIYPIRNTEGTYRNTDPFPAPVIDTQKDPLPTADDNQGRDKIAEQQNHYNFTP